MAAMPSVVRLLRVILFCSSLLLVSPHAIAQTVTGGLHFSVADSLGNPLDGVIASVAGPEIQGVRSALSDRLGRCTIPVLPPGIVSLRLTHPGYHPTVVENIRIQLSRTTALGTVVLQQSVYDLPEVVVSSERAYIDANSSTYGSNLRPVELDALPMDRDYRDMVSMLPQSNLSYFGDGVNIGGATGAENKNVVDGVEVTDPLIQGSGTVLPYNFIREVEVKAGGYEADTRGTLGGVLNVVTYSGTNELHGSAFGFYTSNRFSADPQLGLSDPTQGGFSNYDVGFSLGGPILPDRLWFFVAYNPRFERRDVNVPSFGISVDRTLVNSFAAKLTWAASERLNLVFTVTGDPSQRDAVGNGVGTPPAGLTTPDSYLMDIGWGGTNFSLNGTYMPSNDILIEASVARVNRHDTGQPATEFGEQEPYYVDNRTDIWSGGPNSTWDSFRWATMGRLAASLTLGGHTLRAGGEYKVNGTDNRYDYDQIYRYDTTYYERYVGKGYQTIHDNIPSIFIHDTWRVTEELSLYGGVRWDGQEIIASDGSLAQKITLPLQPRIGFAFVPDESRVHKIFGSFGRYAQEFALFQAMVFSDQGYDAGFSYDHDPRVSPEGADTIYYTPFAIGPGVEGLRGQYFDEFSLGYEHALDNTIRVRVQGVYRTIREVIDDAYLPSEQRYVLGNPGSGNLSEWPKPKREYVAMVVSIERSNDRHFNFLASYVLSRNYGNYGGVFDAFLHSGFPNVTTSFDDLENTKEFGMGLLPNDRTHVFKFSGSYLFDFGLSAGVMFIAQTGTPLSIWASQSPVVKLQAQRGTNGRMPAIWDLSARIAYRLPFDGSLRTRLLLDVFHIASQKVAVDIEQWKGRLNDQGEFYYLYDNYGKALRYQPPTSVRLGLEVGF